MRFFVFFILSILSTVSLAVPYPITFWHGMAGHLGSEINHLADQFNAAQTEFKVIPVYKGDYIETMTSFSAAFRAGQPPDLVQIYEVGTETMLHPKGVIKPIEEVVQHAGFALPVDDFIPAVKHFYAQQGQLQALPLNVSVPVMYYNADALAKLGYDGAHIPKTYEQLQHVLEKAKKQGYTCGWTSAYPSWILLESYAALHGLTLVDANQHAHMTQPALTAHLQRLKDWQLRGYFQYGGRVDEATAYFTSGRCLMFSQSSGAYNSLAAMLPFKLGVTALPLDETVSKQRHANLIGGAAMWAVAGKSEKTYQGIAQFAVFLAKPSVQKEWQQATGYLPLGMTGAYAKTMSSLTHPTLALAYNDLQFGAGHYRFAGQNRMRQSNDQLLEALFANMYSAEKTLLQAQHQAEHVLKIHAALHDVPFAK